MLLSDLGRQTMMEQIQSDQPAANRARYLQAVDTLLAWQLASRPGVLPAYDEPLLRRELQLFPDWYLARHKGVALAGTEAETLAQAFDSIVQHNLAGPSVYVHRDFMPRNLMIPLEPGATPAQQLGVLDFQDAVYGPISYDLASLLKDAYIRWDEDFILDLLVRYWETARKLGLPVRAEFSDFFRDFEWMGVQRHLKVLGIFARLHHRDGKDGYLADMPLVMDYLRRACKRYRELGPLLKLLNRIDPEDTRVGYTF